jgi:hypothetical protein
MGKPAPNKGIPHTPETKAKIRAKYYERTLKARIGGGC